MKKYTTPEVELIKFQALETIAEGDSVTGSVTVGTKDPDEGWGDGD